MGKCILKPCLQLNICISLSVKHHLLQRFKLGYIVQSRGTWGSPGIRSIASWIAVIKKSFENAVASNRKRLLNNNQTCSKRGVAMLRERINTVAASQVKRIRFPKEEGVFGWLGAVESMSDNKEKDCKKAQFGAYVPLAEVVSMDNNSSAIAHPVPRGKNHQH